MGVQFKPKKAKPTYEELQAANEELQGRCDLLNAQVVLQSDQITMLEDCLLEVGEIVYA